MVVGAVPMWEEELGEAVFPPKRAREGREERQEGCRGPPNSPGPGAVPMGHYR